MRRVAECTVVILVLLCLVVRARAQTHEVSESAKPKSEVLVSASKKSRVGEPLTVTLQVKNVGKTPFYITRAIQAASYLGGFEVLVTPPPGARTDGGAVGGDFFGQVDIMKQTEQFILLVPGAMYGGTITALTIPMSPGTYQIVGKRLPPLISGQVIEKLESVLKFPVLMDAEQSKPISIKVTK